MYRWFLHGQMFTEQVVERVSKINIDGRVEYKVQTEVYHLKKHNVYNVLIHNSIKRISTLWEIWNERGGGQPPEWESKQFAPDLKIISLKRSCIHPHWITPQNWTQEGKLSASTFKRDFHPQRAYWFWECMTKGKDLYIYMCLYVIMSKGIFTWMPGLAVE